jgi:hypothetical protein
MYANKSKIPTLLLEKENTPTSYKTYTVDFKDLQQVLKEGSKSSSQTIQLPTSTGIQELVIKETSSFSKELSEKYPMIQSFTGYAKNDGQIQNTDYLLILPIIGNAGYSLGDFNMNSQIQVSDINLFSIPNVGKGRQF